jgi:DNA-binding transcriptional LysR family regulator
VEGLVSDFLPAVIARMLAKSPLLNITVTSAGSDAVGQVVSGGDADIGLAFDLKRVANLKERSVGRFPIGAVVTPDHPLAERASLRLSDCISFPLILADGQLSIRRLLEPYLEKLPASPLTVVESNSITLLKMLAMRGVGIAFQTKLGLEDEIARGLLVHIPIVSKQPILSTLGIFVRLERALPVAVEGMVRAIAEELALREEAEHISA